MVLEAHYMSRVLSLVRTALFVAALALPFPVVAQQASSPAPVTQPVMAETIDAAIVRANAGLDKLLPRRAETAYQALTKRFQPSRAMEVVTFMDRYWRVA